MKGWQNIFKRGSATKAVTHHKPELTNPDRDWTFLLALATVGAFSIAAFSYISFVNYYNIDQRPVEVTVQTIHYQGSQISEQVKSFAAKRIELDAFIKSIPAATTSVEQAAMSRRPFGNNF